MNGPHSGLKNHLKHLYYAFDYPLSQIDKEIYQRMFKIPVEQEKQQENQNEKSLKKITEEFMANGQELLHKIANSQPKSSENKQMNDMEGQITQINSKLSKFQSNSKSNLNKIRKELKKTSQKAIQSHDKVVKSYEILDKKVESLVKRVESSTKVVEKKEKDVNVEEMLIKMQQRLDKVEKELEQSKKSKKKVKQSVNSADIEDILVRFAAFGDERIEHIEIIGNGERTSEGTSVRKVVMESQLGNKEFEAFKVPKSWSTHSDSTTINLNFKQLTAMFNDVVIKRVDTYETQMNKKMTHLEKKVDIIQKLLKTKGKETKPVGQKLENLPKTNHQGHASAGRAAFNRKKEKEKVKLH